MGSQSLPRKLAAVLFADVAGYTRLTAADEDTTHRRLAELLDLVASTVGRHGGRVMHYAGDAVLAMFGAVVDALNCAAEIQRELGARNSALPNERKVEFRIGVNLGDVIEDRGDIYGDGVNVAARLHELAAPGGICVSESVRTAVGDRLPLTFQYLGKQSLKNVEQPVRAYFVHGAERRVLSGWKTRWSNARQALTKSVPRRAVLIATVALGGALATLGANLGGIRDRLFGGAAAPINSIAVLPLDNLSGDPDQEYFVDGLTEAVTAELGQISALRVTSRTSAMRFKKKDVLLPEIARQLNVDALLEGAVLRAGDEVRITLELVHGKTDRHIKAWNFQRPMRGILALQADVARTIATDMKITLTAALRNKLRPGGESAKSVDPRAYESYWKGRYAFNNAGGGLDGFRNAIAFYEKAIDLDPTFALAYAAIAEVCLQPPVEFAGIRTRESCEHAARMAVALDEDLAEAHAALGDVLTRRWDWQASEAEFKRALQLNPSSVLAHQGYSDFLRITMRLSEAEQQIRLAEEIDPFNLFVKTMVGWPLFSQRRYDEALAAWAEVLELEPDYPLALYNQGLAYAMLGMPERVLESARRAAKRMEEDSLAIVGLTALGHALHGDRTAATDTLADLEQNAGPASIDWISTIHLVLGEEREALAWLEKGVDMHATLVTTSEPWWDSLRGDPRFQEIRRRMGLPQ